MSSRAPWITYRPELKVLDCTIRDGGLINAHQFTDDMVRAVYQSCIAAGIDYMEVGYKNSPRLFPKDKFGPWRHTDEADLQRLFADHDPVETGLKLSAMADAAKSDWKTQIVPASESPLSMIRVAFYDSQVPEAMQMIQHAHDMGYETMANLMAVTTCGEDELDEALIAVRNSPAEVVVIVDSFGHLIRHQVERLVERYMEAMEGTGKLVGVHFHNNLQLAFANTIEAVSKGVNRVDATMFGLGRGAGNCPMELLLGLLRNPKFKQRPVIELIQQWIVPFREQFEWGPLVPYNLTGQMNRHPRAAMEWRAGKDKDDFLAFYDKLVADV